MDRAPNRTRLTLFLCRLVVIVVETGRDERRGLGTEANPATEGLTRMGRRACPAAQPTTAITTTANTTTGWTFLGWSIIGSRAKEPGARVPSPLASLIPGGSMCLLPVLFFIFHPWACAAITTVLYYSIST